MCLTFLKNGSESSDIILQSLIHLYPFLINFPFARNVIQEKIVILLPKLGQRTRRHFPQEESFSFLFCGRRVSIFFNGVRVTDEIIKICLPPDRT